MVMDIDSPQTTSKKRRCLIATGNNKRAKRKSTSKPVTPKIRPSKGRKTPKGKVVSRKTEVITVHTKTRTTRVTQKVVYDNDLNKIADSPLNSENKVKLNKKEFYSWRDDDFVIKTLQERGWTFLGELVNDGREDYPDCIENGAKNKAFNLEHTLIWADDQDSEKLAGYAGNYLMSSIPKAAKYLTKTKQQLLFNKYPWFPKCYTLPKEKSDIFNFVNNTPDTYWIAKPRDSYGGFGMCVFKGGSPEFLNMCERSTTFVVQRYMTNPYLFGGLYKFHVRAYMCVTNASDPYRAYLWRDAQIQFATHEFNLNEVEKKFNKYCHITNYKVNNEKKNNQFVIQDKPGIGIGTEWAIKKFFQYMTRTEPKFSEEKFWKDMTKIARAVGTGITGSNMVRSSTQSPEKHFEIYGLDILMDCDCNLAMTEANTQPGLDFTEPVMSNGQFNDNARQANDVTKGIINDTLTLIGADEHKSNFAPWIPLH